MQGLRPFLHLLWPDLHGRALREQAAAALHVNPNTVYDWERCGMARAATAHTHRVQRLCLDILGFEPAVEQLLHPSN